MDCTFSEAFVRFWKGYVDFENRASRKEYWYWVLWSILLGAILGSIQTGCVILLPGAKETISLFFNWIDSLWGLVTFLPSIAIVVRRLKDAGRSWTNIFWLFLPLIGWIILLIRLCEPSL